MASVALSKTPPTIEDVVAVARDDAEVTIDPAAMNDVAAL